MASEDVSNNCPRDESVPNLDETNAKTRKVTIPELLEPAPILVCYRDIESLRLLYGLSTRDPAQRNQALDNVTCLFDGWLEGYGSPKETCVEFQTDGGTNGLSTDMKPLIQEQLPDLLRLSLTCPFDDTRVRCAAILADLNVSN
jgi:hypothetical protein